MQSKRRVRTMQSKPIKSPLEIKLAKLEKMLKMTYKISEPSLQNNPNAAAAFTNKMQNLIGEIHSLDLEIENTPSGAVRNETELKMKIRATVKRLAKANASMMATIKVQQEKVGDKIMKLKQKKALLKSAPIAREPRTPSLVDREF